MKPLFILPFDHRSGLTRELFSIAYPPNATTGKKIAALKRIIFEGFLAAYPTAKKYGDCGILVDEEFGTPILNETKRKGIIFAVSTETSGGSTFDFVHKRGFGRALIERDPTYAKALVNYNLGDDEHNHEKMKKLQQLSEFCDAEGIPLMLEPLVHGKKSPLSMATTMIRDMNSHGVFPALWKLEMQRSAKDWKKLAAVAKVPMILLGHGESMKVVDEWVIDAAKSGAVDGFAIGRTIFFEPIKQFHEKTITKKQAVESIAKNYLHFVKLWSKHAV
jgi:myo-inositol catabolism protein IolC